MGGWGSGPLGSQYGTPGMPMGWPGYWPGQGGGQPQSAPVMSAPPPGASTTFRDPVMQPPDFGAGNAPGAPVAPSSPQAIQNGVATAGGMKTPGMPAAPTFGTDWLNTFSHKQQAAEAPTGTANFTPWAPPKPAGGGGFPAPSWGGGGNPTWR